MRVMSYTTPALTLNKNISFGDDCGYVPNSFRPSNAMKEMRRNGYIIRGVNTKDAFERFYDDVNHVLNATEKKPEAISQAEFLKNPNVDRRIKFVVKRWDMAKNDFANMMTKFWNVGKNNIQSKEVVADFLTKTEGMKKPNFFQSFLPKYTEYLKKEGVIQDVVYYFLKDGLHIL